MTKLELVSGAALPDPPYPADTRAGNYAMRLDVARVHQSTTWKLANAREQPPELSAWLLKLWAESWLNIPCATLPDDDEEIAAMIAMPIAYFKLHRAILMRGWRKHSDGRLYHSATLVALVFAMMRERDKYRQRQIRQRDRPTQVIESTDVTVASRGCHAHDVDVDVDVKALPLVKGESEGKSAKPSARGTALAHDTLPDEWREWTMRVHKLDVQRTTKIWLKFRDHWKSTTKNYTKRDWFATWKNWIRKECGE